LLAIATQLPCSNSDYIINDDDLSINGKHVVKHFAQKQEKSEAGVVRQQISRRRIQRAGKDLNHVYGDAGGTVHDLTDVPLRDARQI
jgi:hypothetical protein